MTKVTYLLYIGLILFTALFWAHIFHTYNVEKQEALETLIENKQQVVTTLSFILKDYIETNCKSTTIVSLRKEIENKFIQKVDKRIWVYFDNILIIHKSNIIGILHNEFDDQDIRKLISTLAPTKEAYKHYKDMYIVYDNIIIKDTEFIVGINLNTDDVDKFIYDHTFDQFILHVLHGIIVTILLISFVILFRYYYTTKILEQSEELTILKNLRDEVKKLTKEL